VSLVSAQRDFACCRMVSEMTSISYRVTVCTDRWGRFLFVLSMSCGINRTTYIDIRAAHVTRHGSRSAVEARSSLPSAQSLQHVMPECVHPFASSCHCIITALRRNISCRNLYICFWGGTLRERQTQLCALLFYCVHCVQGTQTREGKVFTEL
jgi:hypothetical protein